MSKLRTRIGRIPRFAKVTYALLLGSVTLVTALSYWQNRLGYSGIGVVGGVMLLTLGAVVGLPDRAWARVVGTDTLAADLGELHAEGARLRQRLPWAADPITPESEFTAWSDETNAWDDRVQERLKGTPWLGTYISPVTGFRTSTSGYGTASQYRNGLDDRLQRLGEIVASVGGRR